MTMPTNLPPDYFEIEKRYRAAQSDREKIELIEEMLSVVPKHKGTDHLRADLRRRLSKLKSRPQSKKGASKRESAFHVDKEGAGQVMVVGPANVGKSTLVAALTHATPEVSAAPYTTWQPVPGMMHFEDIQIQLVDTPSLNPDFIEPALMDLIRRADLILALVDLQTFPIQQLEDTIALLEQNRIVPRRWQNQYDDPRRIVFVPLQVLANKNDDERSDGDFQVLCELLEENWPLLSISATTGRNLERLRTLVYERLEIMRIYSKPPGQPPDLSAPFVMHQGGTIHDLAGAVHQDFARKLKSARVWGTGVYDGQMVGRDHILHDGDIVELRI
jgi:ribosome-interacting GTPase 1